MFNHFNTISASDRQTDRRTDGQTSHEISGVARVKIGHEAFVLWIDIDKYLGIY